MTRADNHFFSHPDGSLDLRMAYGPRARTLTYCRDLLESIWAVYRPQHKPPKNVILSCQSLYALQNYFSATQEQKLCELLQIQPAHGTAGTELWAAPRAGVITPWCSKAKEIMRQCGLAGEAEMLHAWRLEFPASMEKSEQQEIIDWLSPRLYDPMRQFLTSKKQFTADLWGWGIGHYVPELQRIELDELAASDKNTMPAGLPHLSDEEQKWLRSQLAAGGRNEITPAEWMMFAQVNSEHCRHWMFNSRWQGAGQPDSLFDFIRATAKANTKTGWKPGLISCYSDNAAVFEGLGRHLLMPDEKGQWCHHKRTVHLVAKAETHNHPTGVSPWPGAATGVGGEIRDEAATGRGARSKMGVCGYMVSAPGWSPSEGRRPPLSPPAAPFAGPRQILVEAPLGAAAFGNEFGRPALAGFLRTLEIAAADVELPCRSDVARWGYDKPLMLAGGLGQIQAGQEHKAPVPAGSHLVVLGGPAMRIGIGGSASSSTAAGAQEAAIDFASVQRENPEMQRRCQEVLDSCWRLGDGNPILFIHDLGAGGLSNAVPELLYDCGKGAKLNLPLDSGLVPELLYDCGKWAKLNLPLDSGLVAEMGMSPEEIWCNESQERFLLAVAPEQLQQLLDICQREACPWAVLGTASEPSGELQVRAAKNLIDGEDRTLVNMPLSALFDYKPQTSRTLLPAPLRHSTGDGIPSGWEADGTQFTMQLAGELLAWPAVASKAFLIQISDRSVGGMTARDQMIGPCQIPVSDYAMTLASHHPEDYSGEAVAVGEKAPLAILNPAASVRMAVAEALTNLAGAGISNLSRVVLSANWMADTGTDEADSILYEGVQAFSQFCCELGIAVPVGKDSLFMRSSAWKKAAAWIPMRNEKATEVVSPMTLIVTAFTPVEDVRKQVTPALVAPREDKNDAAPDSVLLHLSGGDGRQRLGASTWQQLNAELRGAVPDISVPQLRSFVHAIGELVDKKMLLAYHDISDGGIFACAFEMALAGSCGVRLYCGGGLPRLLCEEAGALLQVRANKKDAILALLKKHGVTACTVGQPLRARCLEISPPDGKDGKTLRFAIASGENTHDSDGDCTHLTEAWTQHSEQVRLARGDQLVAVEAKTYGSNHQRLAPSLDDSLWCEAPAIIGSAKPKVAILREQGVNGQREMAAAFLRAGFQAEDVHINDLKKQPEQLQEFSGLAFCGGFSYGDTLGAGRGWGLKIIRHEQMCEQFAEFFKREDRFTLGICNGCQTLAAMRSIIPGAEHWPDFVSNQSERFEARLVQVRISDDAAENSPLLRGMGGQLLLVPVSHGEGRALFAQQEAEKLHSSSNGGIACNYAASTDAPPLYPLNPNGSEQEIAGIYAAGGRVLAMMPHPERVFRTVQLSWAPKEWRWDTRGQWREDSPWMQLFYNARKAVS